MAAVSVMTSPSARRYATNVTMALHSQDSRHAYATAQECSVALPHPVSVSMTSCMLSCLIPLEGHHVPVIDFMGIASLACFSGGVCLNCPVTAPLFQVKHWYGSENNLLTFEVLSSEVLVIIVRHV